MTRHFEQVWEQAELACHPLPKEDLLARLRKLLEAPTGFLVVARTRAMGDLLMSLANLSSMDNIDVFAALEYAIQRSSIPTRPQNEKVP